MHSECQLLPHENVEEFTAYLPINVAKRPTKLKISIKSMCRIMPQCGKFARCQQPSVPASIEHEDETSPHASARTLQARQPCDGDCSGSGAAQRGSGAAQRGSGGVWRWSRAKPHEAKRANHNMLCVDKILTTIGCSCALLN